MGERFLVLDEAATALDAVDPSLAEQFRIANGLPASGPVGGSGGGASTGPTASAAPLEGHDIRMAVDDRVVRAECSCRTWTSEVDWDGIDVMVSRIRQHVGSDGATSQDGIEVDAPSSLPESWAG
jgi:hypothetical protein